MSNQVQYNSVNKQTSLKENTNSWGTSDRWETAPDINVVRFSVIHFKLSQKFTKPVPFEWLICEPRWKKKIKDLLKYAEVLHGISSWSDQSVFRVNRYLCDDVTVLKALGLIAIIMTMFIVWSAHERHQATLKSAAKIAY